MKVSICIPTCNRPNLLRDAIDSCISQSILPHEILIGDDSSDDKTAELICKSYVSSETPVPIRYFHHKPSLRQARNVDFLLRQVTGDLIALLHDDDLLCNIALERLIGCFVDPTVAFAYGKQLLSDENGSVDHRRSEALNRSFRRGVENAGKQSSFLDAAITQQVPNDGYLLRADVARSVGYIEGERLMGDACDFGFAVLCAIAFPAMTTFFIDDYTAVYRESATSITRGNPNCDTAYSAFKYVTSLGPEKLSRPAVKSWLEAKAPTALAQAINLGLRRDALSIYLSPWHRRQIVSMRGAKSALKLLLPRWLP